MNLKHIKAVAFDLDGTLVDSIPDLAAAANAMREHLDLPPLPALRIQEHVGDGIASLVHRALTNERDGQADPALWERGYVFFIQYYREHLSDNTSIYPGVTDGLGLLRALQLPLAVITNKSERLALPLLEQLGLRDHFSLIIGGDTLAEKKPSALPLQHVCQVLGIAPEQMAMVGDSANDVLAARNAGCAAVAVSYGYADAAALGADLVVANIAELYDLMKNS
ncbi:phosphoglycolate phosphatase [Chromobacterium sp. LK1]|uniref:phosphoglycolate phosphatase n=1 Tax=Chromobacterium sp. LK1 TaxID=1628193 RepID=UPI000654AFDB|nr:phosphoglycolate phosphatase [Chromobacterium sp. LK1]KMN32230.1 phosphoglycolate phosphatase [Chromobacterium sp. LK1]